MYFYQVTSISDQYYFQLLRKHTDGHTHTRMDRTENNTLLQCFD